MTSLGGFLSFSRGTTCFVAIPIKLSFFFNRVFYLQKFLQLAFLLLQLPLYHHAYSFSNMNHLAQFLSNMFCTRWSLQEGESISADKTATASLLVSLALIYNQSVRKASYFGPIQSFKEFKSNILKHSDCKTLNLFLQKRLVLCV